MVVVGACSKREIGHQLQWDGGAGEGAQQQYKMAR